MSTALPGTHGGRPDHIDPRSSSRRTPRSTCRWTWRNRDPAETRGMSPASQRISTQKERGYTYVAGNAGVAEPECPDRVHPTTDSAMSTRPGRVWAEPSLSTGGCSPAATPAPTATVNSSPVSSPTPMASTCAAPATPPSSRSTSGYRPPSSPTCWDSIPTPPRAGPDSQDATGSTTSGKDRGSPARRGHRARARSSAFGRPGLESSGFALPRSPAVKLGGAADRIGGATWA